MVQTNAAFESSLLNLQHFWIEAPIHPHVSRTDGGHIMVHPNVVREHRWEFSPEEGTELMRISMLLGKAMLLGLNERGIPVERINFQDNGNWALGEGKRPQMHLHLYGRAKNSVNQVHGEALYFPDRETGFYKKLEPLHAEDIAAIEQHCLRIIAAEPQLQSAAWQLRA